MWALLRLSKENPWQRNAGSHSRDPKNVWISTSRFKISFCSFGSYQMIGRPFSVLIKTAPVYCAFWGRKANYHYIYWFAVLRFRRDLLSCYTHLTHDNGYQKPENTVEVLTGRKTSKLRSAGKGFPGFLMPGVACGHRAPLFSRGTQSEAPDVKRLYPQANARAVSPYLYEFGAISSMYKIF